MTPTRLLSQSYDPEQRIEPTRPNNGAIAAPAWDRPVQPTWAAPSRQQPTDLQEL
ncbi:MULTISPECIES: hypothetical protein [unclassified Streptomyces]|uniref:hypothetical protein n=1 Tax=unclassified Streptomyces TaxID=2593676 RepID=UPI00081D804A|nr:MULTISPECIES: hypothetical protein [unclassified Streptomyces]MYZ35442.1 hypothetical protein [Streptomyces sp. SID4917]SCF75507.1 hypothetical protein GA0115259_1020812 [Streptomyces sp. MnatMP-M17]